MFNVSGVTCKWFLCEGTVSRWVRYRTSRRGCWFQAIARIRLSSSQRLSRGSPWCCGRSATML